MEGSSDPHFFKYDSRDLYRNVRKFSRVVTTNDAGGNLRYPIPTKASGAFEY